jgi:hypothetical protein
MENYLPVEQTTLGVWSITDYNPETKYVKIQDDKNVSVWIPIVFWNWHEDSAKLRAKAENLRKSRDYFKQERDSMKIMHTKVINDLSERLNASIKNNEIIGNVESAFECMKEEIGEMEQKISFWKTIAIALGIFGVALFGLICVNALK